MATKTQVATVVANIITAVPTHAAIPTQILNDRVAKLLSDLDAEVVAQATFAAQNAEKSKH